MNTSLKQRIEAIVLSKASLLSISDQLRQMKDEGIDQASVETILEELRQKTTNEQEEDFILEVLDLVTGFCAPERRVWDH